MNVTTEHACVSDFKTAMADLHPGDDPSFALEHLTVDACIPNADAVPSKF